MAGHNLDEKDRTTDVEIDKNIMFSKMFLTDPVVLGLSNNNFIYPSPIQARAIPLGKCGLDLLVQAKSGTGKTLVFAIIILEKYNPDLIHPQSLVIVPTREIAVQVESVLNKVGYSVPAFKAKSFIGGMDVGADRANLQKCSCVVGTPGRILHLIRNNTLNLNEITTLVMDEADQLMNASFKKVIDVIISHLSRERQTIVSSATFYNNIDRELVKYLNEKYIGVTPKKEIPLLLGIKQYVSEIPEEKDNIKEMKVKIKELNRIFSNVPFSQCLAFSNSQTKAESYCNYLNKAGWPSEVIQGGQNQQMRLKTMDNLKNFKCRILTATDVISRGIDAENVNLVINLDVPRDSSVYLHRIGRAGRFGTQGIAITLVSSVREMAEYQNILFDIGGKEMSVFKLPQGAEIEDLWNMENQQKYEKINGFYDATVGVKEKKVAQKDDSSAFVEEIKNFFTRNSKYTSHAESDIFMKDLEAKLYEKFPQVKLELEAKAKNKEESESKENVKEVEDRKVEDEEVKTVLEASVEDQIEKFVEESKLEAPEDKTENVVDAPEVEQKADINLDPFSDIQFNCWLSRKSDEIDRNAIKIITLPEVDDDSIPNGEDAYVRDVENEKIDAKKPPPTMTKADEMILKAMESIQFSDDEAEADEVKSDSAPVCAPESNTKENGIQLEVADEQNSSEKSENCLPIKDDHCDEKEPSTDVMETPADEPPIKSINNLKVIKEALLNGNHGEDVVAKEIIALINSGNYPVNLESSESSVYSSTSSSDTEVFEDAKGYVSRLVDVGKRPDEKKSNRKPIEKVESLVDSDAVSDKNIKKRSEVFQFEQNSDEIFAKIMKQKIMDEKKTNQLEFSLDRCSLDVHDDISDLSKQKSTEKNQEISDENVVLKKIRFVDEFDLNSSTNGSNMGSNNNLSECFEANDNDDDDSSSSYSSDCESKSTSFFENETSNAKNDNYLRTYSNWTNQYWNQLTQINDFVRFNQYVKRKPTF